MAKLSFEYPAMIVNDIKVIVLYIISNMID